MFPIKGTIYLDPEVVESKVYGVCHSCFDRITTDNPERSAELVKCETFTDTIIYIFISADADGSNNISRQELTEFFMSVSPALHTPEMLARTQTPEDAKALFTEIWLQADPNSDGRLDMSEFSRFVRIMAGAPRERWLQRCNTPPTEKLSYQQMTSSGHWETETTLL